VSIYKAQIHFKTSNALHVTLHWTTKHFHVISKLMHVAAALRTLLLLLLALVAPQLS